MKYLDRVYGEFEINESVVLDLINSNAIQRLKKIDQAGYRALWAKPETDMGELDNSRFAHSVGVYLLLNQYNATLEEQIAGLIHDVSHSAFSHCTEYIFNIGNEHKQDYQDNTFDYFVKSSDIPKILEKYNLDINYILDDKNFPLKENDLPDICADRIDYSLRTAVIFKEISFEKGQYILSHLKADNGKWFFDSFESAKKYAELFLKINDIHYAGLDSAKMYEGVRGFVNHAMEMGYVTKDDLYIDDDFVIKKICNYLETDGVLRGLWERMNDKDKIIEDFEEYDKVVNCKSRIIDPYFKRENKLVRVSEEAPEWGEVVKKKMQSVKHFLRFVD